MTFIVADRVQETTNSPGTGTATLLGAVSGYQSFSTGVGANNTTFYVIADQLGTNWEVGLGALNSTGTVLTRTTVYSSSNGGSTVNFATGTQYVWCDFPSSKAVIQGTAVNFSSIGATTAGTGAFTTLSASSTISGAGFSNYFAAPPTIGNTTPNAGTFTDLTYTGTLTGGTGVVNLGSGQFYKDASGNVGIGTTTMAGRLNVNATGANSRIAIGDTASGTYSTVLMYGGSGKYNFQLGVQNNVNNCFEITPSTATGGTTFSTPSFVVNATGGVALQGATVTANGVGITFPATQSASSDANTLDDYEEGTWTPTFAFGGGTTGVTYSTNVGTYIKVGRLVTLWCYLVLTNKGSSTGAAVIRGMPFAQSMTYAYGGGNSQFYGNFASLGNGIIGDGNNGATEINLYTGGAVNSGQLQQAANFGNFSAIEFVYTYLSA